jgi:septum formation inhibitor-activating ATPase MinD
VAEVEKGLGLEVDTVIERDASLISESINLGRPAVLMKKSSFDRAVNDLADRIVRPSKVTVQRTGFLHSLLRPFRSNGSAAAPKEVN